jgi:2-phospho-L-lactate guanylyltransferase
MPTWAIVPVKYLNEAKSSLSPKLNPDQRRELVLCMLADVLDALDGTSLEALVVSPDDKVLDFAGEHRATCLKEPDLELNEALKLAIRHAVVNGADSVLILPADLPLLKISDVKGILALATSPKAVVIAPSKANGTNALFLRPPDVIELRFGGESFPLHVAESTRAGIEPRVYCSPTIALDVDEPADLSSIESLGLGTRTHELLAGLK